MIRAALALVCLGISFNGAAQLSPRDSLLRAKANYERTQHLSFDMNVKAQMMGLLNFTLPLVWTRDGDRFRLDTDGPVLANGERATALMPATICIFDGREHWTYTEFEVGDRVRREAEVYSGAEAAQRVNQQWFAGLCLDGVLYGDREDVFTILLRHIDVVTSEPATLDGHECIHMTATVPEGEYELWLDPSADYRLRKSIVLKAGDNPYFGKPIRKSTDRSAYEATVTDIEIKQVQGGTLAVSGKMRIQGIRASDNGLPNNPEGDLYEFSRDNCRFEAELSKADLALNLPDDVQVIRQIDSQTP